MDDELRYRAELADQFIARLADMTEDDWRELAAVHPDDDNFYRLALELATEATQLLGSDRVAEYQTVLHERSARIDEILLAVDREDGEALPAGAAQLAKAAMHALLVRDTYGFNSGAFAELFRPFRGVVEVADLERAASKVRTPPSSAVMPAPRNVA